MALYPSKNAGPGEIRSYLTTVMITKHELSPSHASSIAIAWTFGREHDLSEKTQADFRSLFEPIGPYLYNSVSEDMAAAWRCTSAGSLNLLLLYSLPVLATILLLRLYQHTQCACASIANGSLPLEHLLWVSGPILIFCNAREAAHRSRLSGDWLFGIGVVLSAIGFIEMYGRLLSAILSRQWNISRLLLVPLPFFGLTSELHVIER
ncbi:hypothetical protein N7491_005847 [Penicillium cf. griseofulvum]|uniref:Uncharacterized protein n=1 Tax=Penicillium cf. griseofulvum TaxID=2972120 RepID=A0A9W9M5D2_9EURO|nr:hypothetical protein N7472_008532 [Penicillium cf. griseofulvum]KAJ5435252.1 hypothetical protein N7491_005847 [Penicillium cf. griseofulvum]KAJ5453086.1 hypothetical protein N7445_001269 [Penicillium cf. griseofulvum]